MLVDLLKPYFLSTSQSDRGPPSKPPPLPTPTPKRKTTPIRSSRSVLGVPDRSPKKAKATAPVRSSTFQNLAPLIPQLKTLPSPQETGDSSIQLGDEIDSDQSSELKLQLLQGYSVPEHSRVANQDTQIRTAKPTPDQRSDFGIAQLVPETYSYSGSASASSGSLPVGVGLKNYTPNEIEAFTRTDMWKDVVSNLPIPSGRVTDRTEAWQVSAQGPAQTSGPTYRQTHDLLASPSPVLGLEADAAFSLAPLISFSPEPAFPTASPGISAQCGIRAETVQGSDTSECVVAERNLLHLGVPWFSSGPEEDDTEPSLNMLFPPLSTQPVLPLWDMKQELDEFDDPMTWVVSHGYSMVL